MPTRRVSRSPRRPPISVLSFAAKLITCGDTCPLGYPAVTHGPNCYSVCTELNNHEIIVCADYECVVGSVWYGVLYRCAFCVQVRREVG